MVNIFCSTSIINYPLGGVRWFPFLKSGIFGVYVTISSSYTNIIIMNIRTLVFLSVIGISIGLKADPAVAQTEPVHVTVAGQDLSLRLGMTIQPRFTYAYESNSGDDLERLGFGIRRFRFRTYANIGEDFRIFSQWEGSGNSVAVLDLRGEYKLNRRTWLRFGRFVGAHPRVMAITLHSEFDIVDRPGIAAVWARNTIGADARDYGAEILYRSPEIEYRVFLANGYNQNNFRNEVNNASITGNTADKGMAISTMLRYFLPEVDNSEIGGYVGVNRSKNPLTISSLAPGVGRGFVSSSAHAYWGVFSGDQPVRVKLDFVSVHYDEVSVPGGGDFQQNFYGGAITGAYLLREDTEVLAMYENYNENQDNPSSHVQVFTVGATYSFSAARGEEFMGRKVTLGYSMKHTRGLDDPSHLLVLQFQILI